MKPTVETHQQNESNLKAMESFFNKYPLEKAEDILQRWLKLSSKNEFINLQEQEQKEFTDFFDELEGLVSATETIPTKRFISRIQRIIPED